jgi:hypothetical protein
MKFGRGENDERYLTFSDTGILNAVQFCGTYNAVGYASQKAQQPIFEQNFKN